MIKPLPRWTRHRCRHPDAYVLRAAGGRVLRDVCPACGAVLGAVAFDTPEDALTALRDAVTCARTGPSARTDPAAESEWSDNRHVSFGAFDTRREMTFVPSADRTEPYDVSMLGEVLQMSPAQWWPRRRNYD